MELTNEQRILLQNMDHAVRNERYQPIKKPIIITGKAGTGKSTIVKRWLETEIGETIATVATAMIKAKDMQQKTNATYAFTVASLLKEPSEIIRMTLPKAATKEGYQEVYHLTSVYEVYALYKRIEQDTNILKRVKDRTHAIHYLDDLLHQKPKATITDIELTRLKGKYNITLEHDIRFTDSNHRQYDDALREINYFIIEEISLINQSDWCRLVELANYHNIVCIATGDVHQLSGIDGEPNEYMNPNVIPTNPYCFTLTIPQRQHENGALYHFLHAISNGKSIQEAYAQCPPSTTDVTCIHDTLANAQLLRDIYAQADMVLAYKNQDVMRINQIIRSERYKNTTNIHQLLFQHTLQANERLLVTTNERRTNAHDHTIMRLTNGTLATFVHMYTLDELKMMFTWTTKTYQEFEAMYQHMQCRFVRLRLDTGEERNVWVSIAQLSNPRNSEHTLRNQPHTHVIVQAQVDFLNTCLHNKTHPLYTEEQGSIIYITYGYALTIHKAQGLEWDNVVYYKSKQVSKKALAQDPLFEQRLDYTAGTRAKKTITIITE